MKKKTGVKRSNAVLVINLLVVIVVSCTLRSPISAVGPVLNQIKNALYLDSFQGSLLTSIPLIIFAACSVLVSRFSQQFSISKFLLYAMGILTFGLFIRVSGTASGLFIGSVFIGLGICIGNVVTPGYIKNKFPMKVGLLTGIFAIAMNLTAAFASGYSVSIGEWTALGWRGSLGIWGILSFIALLIVAIDIFSDRTKLKKVSENITVAPTRDISIFKSSQAWAISIFMGAQSLIYYTMIAWLPIVMESYGMSEKQSGWILFAMQMAMLPATFAGPVIANRMKNQRLMIFFVCVPMLVSILMLLFIQSSFIYLSAILMGISVGLAFSLALLFFSLRTKSSQNAIRISGMAQSVGYLIAAFGPSTFGKLHDWSDSWKSSFYFLLFIVVVIFYFGMKAATHKYIEDK